MRLTEKETFNFGAFGFVGLVEFYNGPRGGRYRSIRTEAKRTEDEATDAVIRIAARRYNVPVRKVAVCKVDSLGKVYGEEVLQDGFGS